MTLLYITNTLVVGYQYFIIHFLSLLCLLIIFWLFSFFQDPHQIKTSFLKAVHPLSKCCLIYHNYLANIVYLYYLNCSLISKPFEASLLKYQINFSFIFLTFNLIHTLLIFPILKSVSLFPLR